MLARGEPGPTGRATHGRPAAFSPEAIVRRQSRQPSPSCGHLQRAYIKCFPRHNIRNNLSLIADRGMTFTSPQYELERGKIDGRACSSRR